MQKTNIARSQKGFTLVELLVVVGIIAALAAVVIPNVGRFAGSGDAAANATELQTVQAAMDLWMADNNATAITANATATDNFADPTDPELFPNYIRQNPTKCEYTWTAGGQVTQSGC